MTLGDRVAVLKDGFLQQVAPPAEVYRSPANVFVAGFIGSPAMNFFEGQLATGQDGARFESGEIKVTLGSSVAAEAGSVVLGVRPQDVEIAGREGADARARVDVVELLGSELLVHLRLEGADEFVVRAIVPESVEVVEDETVGLRFKRDRLHLFEADQGRRLN